MQYTTYYPLNVFRESAFTRIPGTFLLSERKPVWRAEHLRSGESSWNTGTAGAVSEAADRAERRRVCDRGAQMGQVR